MKKLVTIKFKSLDDFKNRIARLWQDQKEDEEYEFIFPDDETEEAFECLVKCFTDGQ